MNMMTRQSVINTVYAELRHPADGVRPFLTVAAMLYHLGVTFDEVEIAAKQFGDNLAAAEERRWHPK